MGFPSINVYFGLKQWIRLLPQAMSDVKDLGWGKLVYTD